MALASKLHPSLLNGDNELSITQNGYLRTSEAFENLTTVTTSDTTVYDPPLRALYVGGAGNVSVVGAGDTTAVTLTAVPVGTTLHVRVKKVMATNTTATLIVGLN